MRAGWRGASGPGKRSVSLRAAERWRLAVAVVTALAVFGLGFWRTTRVVRRAREDLESWRAVAASLAT